MALFRLPCARPPSTTASAATDDAGPTLSLRHVRRAHLFASDICVARTTRARDQRPRRRRPSRTTRQRRAVASGFARTTHARDRRNLPTAFVIHFRPLAVQHCEFFIKTKRIFYVTRRLLAFINLLVLVPFPPRPLNLAADAASFNLSTWSHVSDGHWRS